MLKISVDRAVLLKNLADGGNRAPIAIEYDGDDCCVYAHEVAILGPSRLVYRPREHDPDDKSATVWLEVDGDVEAK